MKKAISLFLILISIHSPAAIYTTGNVNQNVTCLIGDTIRFIATCAGAGGYEVYIFDGQIFNSNQVYYLPSSSTTNTPVANFLCDYVITGNEASWEVVHDDINVCGNDGTFSILNSVITAPSSGELSLFPNPAIDEITIGAIKTASITVYDPSGREIKMQKFCNENIKLDLGDLPSGIYFLRVENDDMCFLEKFIKE
jgi:hypothetical protein